MKTYKEIKAEQTRIVNSIPMGFAYSNDQFKEMMAKWGLDADKEEDLKKIVRVSTGGFIQKKHRKLMHNSFELADRILKDAIAEDKTGEDFIRDMFRYELANHEYIYSYDLDEVVEACGITAEEYNASEKMQHAMDLARKEYLADMERMGY